MQHNKKLVQTGTYQIEMKGKGTDSQIKRLREFHKPQRQTTKNPSPLGQIIKILPKMESHTIYYHQFHLQ